MNGASDTTPVARRFDAIVLAGGEATRFGGVDKALLEVGGSTMLDRVLDAVAGATTIVCVGPPRPTSVPVVWTREDPPGGGPTPALAAGLELVTAPIVVVLAVDVPLVTRELVHSLVSMCEEGALTRDSTGVSQPLIAAYDSNVLRDRLSGFATRDGVPVSAVVDGITKSFVDAPGAAADCDTWAELELVRKEVADV